MTEFVQTCKRIQEVNDFINAVEEDSFSPAYQPDLEKLELELKSTITASVSKFKARIEDPDPAKRTYGAAMTEKVKTCLRNFEDLLQNFTRVSKEVAANHVIVVQEQKKQEEEQHQKTQAEELAKKEKEQEEERLRQQEEQEQLQQQQEEALRQLEEQRQIFARQQDWERSSCSQKETEEWMAIEKQFHMELQQIEAAHAQRRRKEEARDEKRRRLGTILEQHRQVKEKGERQLIAEAIAMSLKDGAQTQTSDPVAPSSEGCEEGEAAADDAAVDKGKESPSVPPAAADLDTEEKLIKQAIELSSQIAATPIASHCQGPRVDKRPDAQSP